VGDRLRKFVLRDARFDPALVPRPISFGTNTLAFVALRGIEPRKLHALNHLRGIGNVVAQIFPRWNPLTSWMRQIEDFQRAA
jgi:hypothetical protein